MITVGRLARRAGLSREAHQDFFEAAAPEAHQDFLEALGFGPDRVLEIRQRSRA